MSVSNRVVLPHQVIVFKKMPIQVVDARSKAPPKYFFPVLGHAFVEERRKSSLVHLARQKIEPGLQSDALKRAMVQSLRTPDQWSIRSGGTVNASRSHKNVSWQQLIAHRNARYDAIVNVRFWPLADIASCTAH
jgi:hypothetical protein